MPRRRGVVLGAIPGFPNFTREEIKNGLFEESL